MNRSSSPAKLTYEPDKFVDRKDALELVLGKARRMAAGEVVARRVVLFYGQRGAGKTWLLRELEYRLQARDYAGITSQVMVLGQESDVESLRWQISPRRPFVLLIDDVSEADPVLLELLEERILAPLAYDPSVLLVLAQRGRPHMWIAPEFRDRSENLALQPFDRQHLQEQIEQQVGSPGVSVAEIERLSGGYPWSIYILATSLPRPTALDDCIALFLQDVDEGLYPYFETLSVLRAFDEMRIGPLFEAYSPRLAGQVCDYADYRELRERLIDTNLAHWERDARGYVLDEPLRRVLEARLLERNPELWLRLHCTAYRLYNEWAQQYPQSAEWWSQEKEYHRRHMTQAGYDAAHCLEEQSSADDS